MNQLLIDAGTTWSKVIEIQINEQDKESIFESEIEKILTDSNISSQEIKYTDKSGKSYNAKVFLLPSSLISKINVNFDFATGHMVKNRLKPDGVYENEIIALAYGAKKLLNNPQNATIVDLGSRDTKWIRFENGKYNDLNWNNNCGSATGATVEMLCRFYNVNPAEIPAQKEKFPVTCGVFAMEKIMDSIANDTPPEIAIAQYINGIAYNTWKFANHPEKIHLSGGFCMNKCFVDSLKHYCEVETLGRYLLLEGLC